MKNKLLYFCLFIFTSIDVYSNDSILVDRVWTERRTIYVNKEEIDSIGEDSLIENYGIACGYDGCKRLEFLRNHQFRKKYPYGRDRLGKWYLEGDILTIVYDKRERFTKRKNKFKIKYRQKYIRGKECPTLYLFETKGRACACFIFCNYND